MEVSENKYSTVDDVLNNLVACRSDFTFEGAEELYEIIIKYVIHKYDKSDIDVLIIEGLGEFRRKYNLEKDLENNKLDKDKLLRCFLDDKYMVTNDDFQGYRLKKFNYPEYKDKRKYFLQPYFKPEFE